MCETALSLSVVQVRLSDAQPSVDRSHTHTHTNARSAWPQAVTDAGLQPTVACLRHYWVLPLCFNAGCCAV